MKRLLLLAFICVVNTAIGQTDRFFHTIDSLVQYQQFQIATNLLERFIEDHPGRFYDQAQAYLLISQNDLRLGNLDKAMVSNQQSMELRERLRTDDVAENFAQLGAIYLKMGDKDQALSYLNNAKELPFEDPQLFGQINSLLASVFAQKKEYEKALEYLEQSLKLMQIELGEHHPDVSSTYFQIANLYRSQGKLKEADWCFKKAMAIELRNTNSPLLKALPNNFIIPLLQRFYKKD